MITTVTPAREIGTSRRNPANPWHHVEELIRFHGDGRVVSDNPAFDREINDVLNLNLPFLKTSRKRVLEAFEKTLEKRGNLPRAVLQRWLARNSHRESSKKPLLLA